MTYVVEMFQRTTRHERKPLAEIVRNFTPNWFTATMGTGGLALALNQFPVAVPGLHAVAIALWLAAANRGVSQRHPAWSGLSVVGVLRRVENQGVEQDVEFAHATRKGQQNSRPLISTRDDIAP